MNETVETLNDRLVDYYGVDSTTGRAMFRIVWANEQTEKRLVSEMDSGVHLLHPMVLEVKKYPYLKDLFVLERLVVVPDEQQRELPVSKLSYEPIWAYCGRDRQYLPPLWSATQFIVDALYAALGKKSLRKYTEDEKQITPEGREQLIVELQEQLFGNETEVGDALAYGEGVTVPHNYVKKEQES